MEVAPVEVRVFLPTLVARAGSLAATDVWLPHVTKRLLETAPLTFREPLGFLRTTDVPVVMLIAETATKVRRKAVIDRADGVGNISHSGTSHTGVR